jgi:Tfp pilus assembly protein PilN
MGVDWKKEIKLSDLFKRSPKEPKVEAAPASPVEPVQQAETLEQPAPEAPAAPTAAVSGSESEPIFATPAATPEKKSSRFRRGAKAPKPEAEVSAAAGTGSAGKGLSSFLKRSPGGPKARRLGRKGKAGPAVGVPLMRAFNLLPKEDVREKQARPTPAKLILVAVAVVLIAALGLGFAFVNARLADREEQRDAAQAELDGLLAKQAALAGEDAEKAQALNAVEQEKAARTAALSTALGPRIAWDRILRDISLVVPEDVWLQGILAGPTTAVATGAAAAGTPAGTHILTINGTTRSQDGVAHFLSRLEVLPEFSEVTLIGSNRTEVGDELVVSFSISAALKSQGGAVS